MAHYKIINSTSLLFSLLREASANTTSGNKTVCFHNQSSLPAIISRPSLDLRGQELDPELLISFNLTWHKAMIPKPKKWSEMWKCHHFKLTDYSTMCFVIIHKWPVYHVQRLTTVLCWSKMKKCRRQSEMTLENGYSFTLWKRTDRYQLGFFLHNT